ncbi:MAG: hypothetical protein QOG53_1374 [Frankiales bacterium]|nr:hypothetical protein [Frankiales bacterium]
MALWHVTLTIGGEEIQPSDVLDALKRLADEQPFLLSGRYATDRAEVRYWEEAVDCGDAAALALRLWGEHRVSAGLPPWRVVGLEVVDESVYRDRSELTAVSAVGAWRPF